MVPFAPEVAAPPTPRPASRRCQKRRASSGVSVRERRPALGLSQESLAEGTSLHWSYLGQVEWGQTNLSLHNIIKIAETLGVDPGDLVTGLHQR